jgi:AcrR family transcriptional regulator
MPRQTPERHEARRAEILTACLGCFARKGFHRTSMRDLCEALAMSPGALYRYFDSKESIILAMIDRDRAQWEEAFASIPADTAFQKVLESLMGIAEQGCGRIEDIAIFWQVTAEATTNPEIAAVLKRHYTAFSDRLELVIRRSQERGEIDATLKPRDAAVFVISCFDGLLARYSFDPDTDWKKLARQFQKWIARAFHSPEPAPTRRKKP